MKLDRPRPPSIPSDRPCCPAPQLEAWLRAAFIDEGAPLLNEEHAHLRYARLGAVWCAKRNSRQMVSVIGQAEVPLARGNAWAKARHDQQMTEWFGEVPDFLLTFDADYAEACGDIEFCALVEHELFHCGQNRDAFGSPRFHDDGRPAFGLRGHDVEEFVGIIRRYGAGAGAGRSREFVEAAQLAPTIGPAMISGVCGTCRAPLG